MAAFSPTLELYVKEKKDEKMQDIIVQKNSAFNCMKQDMEKKMDGMKVDLFILKNSAPPLYFSVPGEFFFLPLGQKNKMRGQTPGALPLGYNDFCPKTLM